MYISSILQLCKVNDGQHWNGTESEQSHAQLPAINYVLQDEPRPFSFNRVMEPGFVLLLALSLLLRSVTADEPPGNKCSPASGREETCVCQVDGGIIDLTPLSNTDGTPRQLLAEATLYLSVYYGHPWDHIKSLELIKKISKRYTSLCSQRDQVQIRWQSNSAVYSVYTTLPVQISLYYIIACTDTLIFQVIGSTHTPTTLALLTKTHKTRETVITSMQVINIFRLS